MPKEDSGGKRREANACPGLMQKKNLNWTQRAGVKHTKTRAWGITGQSREGENSLTNRSTAKKRTMVDGKRGGQGAGTSEDG